jgi:hypothetical protein
MIDQQQQYDLSIKKLKTNFYETNEKFTSTIYIKQIRDCQVHFTETNFTITFHTEYEERKKIKSILFYLFILVMNNFLILI